MSLLKVFGAYAAGVIGATGAFLVGLGLEDMSSDKSPYLISCGGLGVLVSAGCMVGIVLNACKHHANPLAIPEHVLVLDTRPLAVDPNIYASIEDRPAYQTLTNTSTAPHVSNVSVSVV